MNEGLILSSQGWETRTLIKYFYGKRTDSFSVVLPLTKLINSINLTFLKHSFGSICAGMHRPVVILLFFFP